MRRWGDTSRSTHVYVLAMACTLPMGACASCRPSAVYSAQDADPAQPRRVLLDRAAAGDVTAERCLGITWRDGIGVPRSRENALRWLTRAAEHGDGLARAELAYIYLDDPGQRHHDGVTTEQIAGWLGQAADRGDPTSAARLVMAQSTGQLRGQPDEFMLSQLERHAVRGDALASHALYSVWRRCGVTQHGQAMVWLRLAASLGRVEAQYEIARVLEDSEGGQTEARGWYGRIAAMAFDPPRGMTIDEPWPDGLIAAAALRAASMTGADLSEASRWLQVAEEFGYGPIDSAALELREKLYLGERPPELSHGEWLRTLAESGNMEAAARLGIRIVDGGAPATVEAGAEWLSKAAAAGTASAQYRLALLRWRDGLPDSETKALVEAAARQGHVAAATLLGELCSREGDLAMARGWWCTAASLGSSRSAEAARARFRLGGMAMAAMESEKAGFWFAWAARAMAAPEPFVALARVLERGDSPDWELVLALYRRAAAGWRHLGAMQALERMYRDGRGTDRNEKEAEDWAQRILEAAGDARSVWETSQ